MATEVGLCSKALYMIGGDPITSLDDETRRANLCKAFLPDIVDAVLRAYPWNCARTRAGLARADGSPATGGDYDWTYHYTLPADPYCLWVPKQLNQRLSYVIEGRKLLSDEASVTIVYICSQEVSLFDSLLYETVAARLASELAFPITGSVTLPGTMWKLYELKLGEARTQDGMEGNIPGFASNALTEVR